MHKAARTRELTLAEKAANRQVSSVRSKVERVFGTHKRGYGFFRARYLGLAKTELEFLLNAIAFNLKKAAADVSRWLANAASGAKTSWAGEKSASTSAPKT